MSKPYKTELEARQAYVLECLKWCGIKEGSADHKALIAWYNQIKPLPRGVTMTATMAWCAAFLSAVAWKLGYRNWDLECSVPRLVEMAKEDGRWRGRDYAPQVGDWIVYDLNKNKSGDHIGVVTGVEGARVFACEGNLSDSVKNRLDLERDDEIILGYIVNNFMEQVDNSNWVGSDRPNIPIEIPELKEEKPVNTYTNVEAVPEYARPTIAMLVERGLLLGVAEDNLGLSDEMVRTLVILDRAGVFSGT